MDPGLLQSIFMPYSHNMSLVNLQYAFSTRMYLCPFKICSLVSRAVIVHDMDHMTPKWM